MTAQTTNRPATALPSVSVNTLITLLIAGAAGTLAFDIWGQVIAPLSGLGGLAPEGLARGFLGKLGLPNGQSAGNLMHLVLIGLLGYPLGWAAVFRPIQARLMPGLGLVSSATLYGVGLWVVAIGGIAGFATGNVFLGFGTITWVALAGHVIYALALVGTLRWIQRTA